MKYNPKGVSRLTRILFPIITTVIAGLVAPASIALVGFLMFGNLIRECGVLGSLSDTAQKDLVNLITLLLGITIAASMKAELFVSLDTMKIMGLGLMAFVFDTIAGVSFAKLMNLFLKEKSTPWCRRSRYFSLSDVVKGNTENGTGGRPAKPPAYARSGCKCIRTDCVSNCRGCHNWSDVRINVRRSNMNTDLINSLKMMGMGMGAIFLVIIIIYIAVNLMLRITGGKKDDPDTARR